MFINDWSLGKTLKPYIWNDAEVTYPDYSGTAQLDYKRTGESGIDAIGIDQDRWFVVGFEIGGGELSHDLRVLAVDRAQLPDGDGSLLEQITDADGHIPVTELLVHDVDPYNFLRSITHQFDLRLRSKAFRNHPIRVTSLGDIPNQD
ncbi:hypothetical protein [Acaricomes phytoseiuli]|uniref:hypothetical protein n=1 Tax=Acaricomes phytoseiuli TaxID=291968 RepID=UPI00035D9B4E|nr:hypothetical protein [Acaricomes phytoseiuli]